MKFFNDGAVNFPYLSDGMWFLTQHKRWGLLKGTPTTWPWPSRSTRSTSTRRPPACAKVSVPKDPMRSSKLIDGVVWDGKNPKAYADGFKIKA
jgi:nitrate/nitrite transport system substrate-binding protein